MWVDAQLDECVVFDLLGKARFARWGHVDYAVGCSCVKFHFYRNLAEFLTAGRKISLRVAQNIPKLFQPRRCVKQVAVWTQAHSLKHFASDCTFDNLYINPFWAIFSEMSFWPCDCHAFVLKSHTEKPGRLNVVAKLSGERLCVISSVRRSMLGPSAGFSKCLTLSLTAFTNLRPLKEARTAEVAKRVSACWSQVLKMSKASLVWSPGDLRPPNSTSWILKGQKPTLCTPKGVAWWNCSQHDVFQNKRFPGGGKKSRKICVARLRRRRWLFDLVIQFKVCFERGFCG